MKKWYHVLGALIVKDENFWVPFLSICPTLGFLIGNLFFMVLYLGKWPCIEQFKGSDEPWPWESDPNWKRTLTRMILSTISNILLAYVIAYIVQILGRHQ